MNILPQKISANFGVAQDSVTSSRYDMALSRYYYYFLLRGKKHLMDNTTLNKDCHYQVAKSHKLIIDSLHECIKNNKNLQTANKVTALLKDLKDKREIAEYNSTTSYSETDYIGYHANIILKLEFLYGQCNII